MLKTLLTLCFSFALVLGTTGCSQIRPPGDGQQPNWDQVGATVEHFTELAARIAFANDAVKPYKNDICTAVDSIAPVLRDFNDPAATFNQVRDLAFQAISNIEGLTDEVKEIIKVVVDQVLNVVFVYVQDSYNDLINNDTTQIVLLVSKSIANGLDAACAGGGLETFSVTKSP